MENATACRFSIKCPMYPKFKNEFGLEVFKKTYCHSRRHTECERFKFASNGTMPPADLLPNGRTLPAQ
ncbi:MAG: hypothetical protein AB8B48_21615 [Pseudomonadales bacterium]